MSEGPTIADNMPDHDRLRYITHGLVGSDSAAYLNDAEQAAAVKLARGMALQLVDDTRRFGVRGAVERLAADLAAGMDATSGRHPDPPVWATHLPTVDPAVVAELIESVDRARADRRRPRQVPSRPAHE